MTAIPFTMEAYGGFGSLSGLLKLEGATLILEFQSKVLGMVRSEPKEVRVPLDHVASMILDEGWFTTKLRIQATSLSVWAGFPESEKGRVVLSLDRSDRPAARDLVALVQPKKAPFDPDFT